MNKIVKIAIAAVGLLAVGAAVLWYAVLRDTAPPEASIAALDRDAASRGTGPAPTTADGNWKVVRTESGFAGYRIQELFASETIKKTAAGRTADVEGSLAIKGSKIESAEVKVDVTTLKSDQSRRDNVIKDRGLQTKLFPEATFKLTEPITLAAPPVQGQEITANAKGDLTLHGQTRAVTVSVKAKWNGGSISVEGSLPISLADYGIEVISIPAAVTIDDNGSMEFQLLFEPA